MEARKILAAEGQRSLFNLIGPLLNPGRPDYQLLGVFDPSLTRTFGEIIRTLGRRGAWVVHGTVKKGGGMDELSTLGPNQICKVSGAVLESATLDPTEFGFAPAQLHDLVGGDATHNAALIEAILSGRDQGPRRDIAVLNAAAGFVITGLAATISEGRELAEKAIDRGAAHAKMIALRDWC